MITPNIWGGGQLFAFSALDGDSFCSDDFVGYLCADKIGIRFETKIKRELILVNLKRKDLPEFKTVASDIITLSTKANDINIIYANRHLIVGNTVNDSYFTVTTEGEHTAEKLKDCNIQNTNDGEFTGILKRGNKFAFAFGHSKEAVISLLNKGIEADIPRLIKQRLKIYELNFLSEDNEYSMLYSKCLSVMKSQLYSPEGRLKKIWSTPDRLPHKYLWLWDSVFHSVGYRNINHSLAEDLILDIFYAQKENGFIPHMAGVEVESYVTQPPVIGWGAYLVYEKSQNKNFLKEVFQKNQKFLLWCANNRKKGEKELYTWFTEDYSLCRCGESGMDNSPRFDKDTVLEAIDFSCFMANETRIMAKIAGILEDAENEAFFNKWYEKIKNDINQKLWSEKDGFYFDFDINNNELQKIWTVASFLPILAGICDQKQTEQLIKHLTDKNRFYTEMPIPSVSKHDSNYSSDMWRGPVWLNYNYMVIKGLENCGYGSLATEIAQKTVHSLNYWYKKSGTVFEYYDPDNLSSPATLDRKGAVFEPYDFNIRYQSVRDYGWSNTICLDLLHNELKRDAKN